VATDVGVGDIATPTLDVTPADNTTVVTLAAIAPDGSTSPLNATGVATADPNTWRFTTPNITYTQPDRWVLLWTVTNTGAGTESQTVWVTPNPTPGGVIWTPSRSRVAGYCPGRTLVPATDGSNTAILTFDDTTFPTGVQVDQFARDAAAWVLVDTGPVHATLYDMAQATAAVYAAACVERGYPERQAANRAEAITTADDLFKQADGMRTDLARANHALTGTDPEDPVAQLVPLWAFPPPSKWGDLDL
jgi:hypothetical protein